MAVNPQLLGVLKMVAFLFVWVVLKGHQKETAQFVSSSSLLHTYSLALAPRENPLGKKKKHQLAPARGFHASA